MTISSEGSEICPIPDIGEVAHDEAGCSLQTIKNATIIGVLQLDTYRSCLRCKARVDPITPLLSKSSCNMHQRVDMCAEHTSAKLLFRFESDMYSLYSFSSLTYYYYKII